MEQQGLVRDPLLNTTKQSAGQTRNSCRRTNNSHSLTLSPLLSLSLYVCVRTLMMLTCACLFIVRAVKCGGARGGSCRRVFAVTARRAEPPSLGASLPPPPAHTHTHITFIHARIPLLTQPLPFSLPSPLALSFFLSPSLSHTHARTHSLHSRTHTSTHTHAPTYCLFHVRCAHLARTEGHWEKNKTLRIILV